MLLGSHHLGARIVANLVPLVETRRRGKENLISFVEGLLLVCRKFMGCFLHYFFLQLFGVVGQAERREFRSSWSVISWLCFFG